MKYDSLQFCKQLIEKFSASENDREKMYLGSLEVSKQHLESSPDAAAVHNNFGSFLRMLPGYTKEAEQELLKAIELDSELPDPYYNLALIYQMDRVEEAKKHLETAIELYKKADREDGGADMAQGLLEDLA